MATSLGTVWLVNPGTQELPDPLGGLGCLGGAEQDLVDVGQALANLQDDVNPGFGCRCGKAFGIAEQQVGRAYLHKQRREPTRGVPGRVKIRLSGLRQAFTSGAGAGAGAAPAPGAPRVAVAGR